MEARTWQGEIGGGSTPTGSKSEEPRLLFKLAFAYELLQRASRVQDCDFILSR